MQVGAAEGGRGREEDMEREVSAAYVGLLLGFLCRRHDAHCAVVLGALQHADFGVVAELLRSFSQLYAEAQLLSPEGASAMSA